MQFQHEQAEWKIESKEGGAQRPPSAAAMSVETRVEDSSVGPRGATGATVDRSDASTASSRGSKQQRHHDPADEQQEERSKAEEEEETIEQLESQGSFTLSVASSVSSTISPMSPVTREAYGGGMYGQDDEPGNGKKSDARKLYDDGSAIPYIQ